MRRVLNFIFSRMVIVGLLILFQLALIIGVIWKLSNYFVYFYIVSVLVSIIVVIRLVSKKDNPSYKLAWAIPIMLFPVFGGFFYLLAGNSKLSKKISKRLEVIYYRTTPHLRQDPKIIKALEEKDRQMANQVKYINDYALFPMYQNTTTKYLSPGESFFESLMEELEKAEHFIFMEYFIIREGEMLDPIIEILERKAKQGVDVRFLYDDIGSLRTVPYKYEEKLRKKGIRCEVFNPLAPVLNMILNNRDHRKITVIDGHTGYMGGINLADEYINAIEKYGHWKDAAIMIKGEAVWNLTMMFLQTWNFSNGEFDDYEKFKPHTYHPEPFESDGYVQPYGDSPLDRETVGENVYLNLLHRAKDYVYISTPYLIVDNEMVTALTLAAKSGLDVRIVTPYKEDKWYVHIVTRAYYKQLLEAGIKIYEYTPGFIHSKTVVSDDEVAIVGSINMDYRSLYLHFECATLVYQNKTVFEVKEDYLKMLEVCTPITLEICNSVSIATRILRSILRLFAPLM